MKMIVMEEMEFRTVIEDWIGCLDEDARSPETVLDELRALFYILTEPDAEGVLVWKGKHGRYPTELIWIWDAEAFARYALVELDMTELLSTASH